jgi:hypothetical protein
MKWRGVECKKKKKSPFSTSFFQFVIHVTRSFFGRHTTNDPGEFGKSCLAYFWVLVCIYSGERFLIFVWELITFPERSCTQQRNLSFFTFSIVCWTVKTRAQKKTKRLYLFFFSKGNSQLVLFKKRKNSKKHFRLK